MQLKKYGKLHGMAILLDLSWSETLVGYLSTSVMNMSWRHRDTTQITVHTFEPYEIEEKTLLTLTDDPVSYS